MARRLHRRTRLVGAIIVPRPRITRRRQRRRSQHRAPGRFITSRHGQVRTVLRQVRRFTALHRTLRTASNSTLTTTRLLINFISTIISSLHLKRVSSTFRHRKHTNASRRVIISLNQCIFRRFTTWHRRHTIDKRRTANTVFRTTRPTFMVPVRAITSTRTATNRQSRRIPNTNTSFQIDRQHRRVPRNITQPLIININRRRGITTTRNCTNVRNHNFTLTQRIRRAGTQISSIVHTNRNIVNKTITSRGSFRHHQLVVLNRRNTRLILSIPHFIIHNSRSTSIRQQHDIIATHNRRQHRRHRRRQVARMNMSQRRRTHPRGRFDRKRTS